MTRHELTRDERRGAMAAIIGRALPDEGDVLVRCIDPAHDDENASMSIAADGRFFCHACGAQGDALSAVAISRGLDIKSEFPRVVRTATELARSALVDPVLNVGGIDGSKPKYARPAGAAAVRTEAAAMRYFAEQRHLDPDFLQDLGYELLLIDGVPHVVFLGETSTAPHEQFRVARALDTEGGRARYRILGTTRSSRKATSAFFQFPGTDTTALAPLRSAGVDGEMIDGDAVDGDQEVATVVITEGVLDLVTALSVDVFAVSLPSGGKNTAGLEAASRALVVNFKKIVVATDGDGPGEAAAEALAAQLYAAGARDIRRVTYPEGTKDLNEVLVRDGTEAVEEVLLAAHKFLPTTAPDSWLDPPSALLKQEEPPDFVLFELIRAGDIVVVAGPGDSGKSMLTLDLAIAFAKGDSTAFDESVVVGDHQVIVLNEEMAPEDVKHRARVLAIGRDLSVDLVAERIRFAHYAGITLTGPSFAKLEQLCRERERLIFIIDSLRPLFGEVLENDNQATLRALRKLDPLRRARKHTFIVLAHEAKGGRDRPEWQAVAGSGAIYNHVDLVVRTRRIGSTDRFVFKIIKRRHLRYPVKPRIFEPVDMDGGVVIRWSEYTDKKKGGEGASESPFSEEAVLNALKDAGKPVTRAAIHRVLMPGAVRDGAAYEILDAVLTRLVEKRLVVRDVSGRYPLFSLVPSS